MENIRGRSTGKLRAGSMEGLIKSKKEAKKRAIKTSLKSSRKERMAKLANKGGGYGV